MKVNTQFEVSRIQALLGSTFRGNTTRASKKVAQAFLLADWFFYNGIMWEPQVKHVGAGIYELSIKEKFETKDQSHE